MVYRSLTCTSTGTRYQHQCQVYNQGPMHGDEVVMVYHVAGDDVRQRAKHPVPFRSLVAYQRFSLGVGEAGVVILNLSPDLAQLVNEDGKKTLYEGHHEFVVSRGPGLKTASDVIIELVV
eukprot:TRINITY_DN6379_c0_g2_i1.p2 TRINITY_DN6379_c0_g2~~TRINITY_DN6379_c0_g2_i1.p2  ORF type:complete len:120 (+),score=22.76 TRINITY_DN6379_c0_g2_i1:1070-1429(+)